MNGERISENVPFVDLNPGDWITGTADGWEIEGRFEGYGDWTGKRYREIVVGGARWEASDTDGFTVHHDHPARGPHRLGCPAGDPDPDGIEQCQCEPAQVNR